MKVLLIILFLFFSNLSLVAQNQFNFLFYKSLLNKKENELAILYLNNSLSLLNNNIQKDSILFFKGLFYYEKKEFDSTIIALKNINKTSSIFNHSVFVKSIAMIYKNVNENEVNYTLSLLQNTDSVTTQMKNLMIASNAIIHQNYLGFDSIIKEVKDTLFIYQSLQNILNKWSEKRKSKLKSIFIASSLSSIVPGLGKVYIGKKFDGLSTFLTHIPLALILYESYNKGGFISSRFITFSAITSILYIGNILTTIHYVNIQRKEVNNDKKKEILLHCNIMLRNYYN